MSTAGERQRGVQPDFDSFGTGFDGIDRVLEGDHDAEELLVKTKRDLVDDFIYSEVLKDVAPEVIEALEQELPGRPSDSELVNAIKDGGSHGDGELYEKFLQLAVDADNFGDKYAIENSIFEDKVEASDAFAIDYILRGGKRLRPFMTLLTEFGLEGETSYVGAMTGASQEIVHASSLEHDDDMDDDVVRRGKLTSERVNNALYGEGSWKQSVLDGNKVEAWGNEAINSIINDPSESFDGIPKQASKLIFQMEADLNDGQKRDIDMENMQLRQADLGDYEEMIAGKTGALFRSGVNIIVEDHLHESDYLRDEREKIRGLFDEYMTSFNRLFQSGDDAIEVFRPENIGKSVTDISNRKITFPAIQTKEHLQQEGDEYAELFLDVFDGAYDEVTSEMQSTAEEMHQEAMQKDEVKEEVFEDPQEMDLTISEDAEAGGEWEEEWLTNAIRMYGKEASDSVAGDYLETASTAVDQLYEMDVINDAARDKYRQMAEFVWNRDH